MALKVMSSKFPMGVGTKYNFIVQLSFINDQ